MDMEMVIIVALLGLVLGLIIGIALSRPHVTR